MPKIWKSFNVDAMAWDDSEENEVHDRARDVAITTLAAKHGVHAMHDRHTHWLHSPLGYKRALKGKSVPKTYTQFLKLFNSTGSVPAPLPSPHSIPCQLTDKDLEKMSHAAEFSSTTIPSKLRSRVDIKFPGGEDEGLRRLDVMVTRRPEWTSRFEKPKTKPNSLHPTTTVLSPYLTHGCVSVRTAYWAVLEAYSKYKGKHSNPPVSLTGQFLWREHWYTIARFTPVDITKMKGNPLSRSVPDVRQM